MRTPASQALGCFWAIRDLYVDPPHRRQGAALSLLDAISADARADGALRLALQTDDGDTPARRLYERYGFTRVESVVQLTLDLRTHERR
jgi:GNAT superfamily N-acetyltransferase